MRGVKGWVLSCVVGSNVCVLVLFVALLLSISRNNTSTVSTTMGINRITVTVAPATDPVMRRSSIQTLLAKEEGKSAEKRPA